jgi:hypothetical protein
MNPFAGFYHRTVAPCLFGHGNYDRREVQNAFLQRAAGLLHTGKTSVVQHLDNLAIPDAPVAASGIEGVASERRDRLAGKTSDVRRTHERGDLYSDVLTEPELKRHLRRESYKEFPGTRKYDAKGLQVGIDFLTNRPIYKG